MTGTAVGREARWASYARELLVDVAAESRPQGVLHSHLDLCVALVEFESVTGEDFGAREVLGESFELMRAQQGLVPWIFGGAAQAGWVALKFSEAVGARAPRLGSIDEVVLRWVEEYPRDLDVDLPRGLLGLGVYGLAHPDATVREKIVGAAVAQIEQRLEWDADGAFVRLADTAHRRATKPNEIGNRDLGMAHGNAGLQAFLAAAAAGSGASGVRARKLLHAVFGWLRHQQSLATGVVFPQSVETRYRAARSAWCYGDPGVALSLLMVEQALSADGRDGSADAAAVLAGRTASAVLQRGGDQLGIHDACLCHGSAGLVYFANRMAARAPGMGWEGYSAQWCEDIVGRIDAGPLAYLFPTGMAGNRSFLEGDLGVALVLLYAATGRRPLWEELLMTSAPGRRDDRMG